MKARIKSLGWLLPLLGVAALFARCESTDLTAPADGTLTVRAVPAAAIIDEESGRGRSTIQAQVLDANAVPVEDAVVTFSPGAGTLQDNLCGGGTCSASGGACVEDEDCPLVPGIQVSEKTDGSGMAEATLVVTADDPESVTVTASSGSLTGTATVTNVLGEVNGPPQAAIEVSPSSPALNGGPIVLDGTGSVDPDGDPLTCFQWTINSSIPIQQPVLACSPPSSNCTVIQGQTESIPTLGYTAEQHLSVTLRVSDDPAALPCARSGPIVSTAVLSPLIANIGTYVLCGDNADPVAVAGTYGPIELDDEDDAQVQVNGGGSSDAETPTGSLVYGWTCGNGQQPVGQTAVCTYTTTGLFQVTLRVTDLGNPEVACAASDTDTTVIQVVDNLP